MLGNIGVPPQKLPSSGRVRVCVVGGGPRFLSGISYYTHRLICALADRNEVCGIVARQLIPTRFYPGRRRVGRALADLRYPAGVEIVDGLDWFWGLSIIRSIRLLRRHRPHVVVLQWWTGALLHSYLALAAVARLSGAYVIIEFHEVQDVGEMAIPLAGFYVDALMPALTRLTDAAIVHSEVDREPVRSRHRFGRRPIVVIPHGPYDPLPNRMQAGSTEDRTAESPFSLLYFGIIRPFKGVEDVVRAFDMLDENEVKRFTLTIVGETWENWTLPIDLVATSRHKDRITLVNRYVADHEVEAFFSNADAVVLPYHRSSASGPLHMAMSRGLPVIVSAVGGLVEAAQDYGGTVFVPPKDPGAVKAAMLAVAEHRGRRYPDPHSWARSVKAFSDLFKLLGVSAIGPNDAPPIPTGAK